MELVSNIAPKLSRGKSVGFAANCFVGGAISRCNTIEGDIFSLERKKEGDRIRFQGDGIASAENDETEQIGREFNW